MKSLSRSKKITIAVVISLAVLACGFDIDLGNQPTTQPPQFPSENNTPFLPATYTLQPTFTSLPTLTPQPTYTPQSTYTVAPTIPTEPMFTANEAAFCRTGPSVNVWPDPQEALKTGQTVKIIGRSTYEWGHWWYVQKASGTRCWVFNELGTTTGNIAGVPEVSAPSTPVPSLVKVKLKNNHAVSLCNIWLADSGKGNWTDLLGGEVLGSSKAMTFKVWPGRYDIEIFDCDGNFIDAEYDFPINSVNFSFTTP